MRLSETITIYLAIAAPFGVNYFLRERSGKEQQRVRALFKAAFAGLLWPLVAAAAFRLRQPAALPLTAAERERAIDERTSEKIKSAQQQLFAALERVRELAQPLARNDEELEQSIRMAREGIEKYTGLTLALAEMSLDAPPAKSEMELCRIAGREGDDLLLAGRCIHRRSVARLVAHQARSRTELLHAFATVRELGGDTSAKLLPDVAAARYLSVAVIKFYGEAINLLSLVEDESAAIRTARLLDAECALLRKLEALSLVSKETIRTDGNHVRHTHTDRGALAQR